MNSFQKEVGFSYTTTFLSSGIWQFYKGLRDGPENGKLAYSWDQAAAIAPKNAGREAFYTTLNLAVSRAISKGIVSRIIGTDDPAADESGWSDIATNLLINTAVSAGSGGGLNSIAQGLALNGGMLLLQFSNGIFGNNIDTDKESEKTVNMDVKRKESAEIAFLVNGKDRDAFDIALPCGLFSSLLNK